MVYDVQYDVLYDTRAGGMHYLSDTRPGSDTQVGKGECALATSDNGEVGIVEEQLACSERCR